MRYGKLLNPYAIERAVRAFVQNTGVRVLFDQEVGGYTDGKTIHVSKLKTTMTEDEALEIYATVIHELGHHLYSDFSLLKIKKERNDSLRSNVWNVLEDARMENLISMDSEGWKQVTGASCLAIYPTLLPKIPVGNPMRVILAFDVLCRNTTHELAGLNLALQEHIETFTEEEVLKYQEICKEYAAMMEAFTIADAYKGTLTTWEIMDRITKLFGEEGEEGEGEGEGEGTGEGEGEEGEEGDGEGEDKEGEATKPSLKADMGATDYTPTRHSHGELSQEEKDKMSADKGRVKGVYGKYETMPIDKAVVTDYSKGQKLGYGAGCYTGLNTKESGGLADKVRRLLQIRARQRRVYGQKKGNLDQRSLYRVGMRNESSKRVFKNKMDTETIKESAVSLLIDMSGSMWGNRVEHACDSAIQMSNVLTNLNIPHSITTFTTEGSSVPRYGLVKQFSEPARDLKDRLQDVSCDMANNVDGEALMFQELALLPRKEKNKVMVVFSDGSPQARRSGTGLSTQLKHVCERIESEGIIKLYGIGIETECVRDYYKNNLVINRSDELEGTLLHLIDKVV